MFTWRAKPRKLRRFAERPFSTIDGQIITLDEIVMKVADLSHEVECLKEKTKPRRYPIDPGFGMA